MAKLWTTLAMLAATAAPALAALPPVYQREREIAAVAQAAAPLLEAPIEAIEVTGDNAYRVRAGVCTLDLAIRILPMERVGDEPPMVGPVRFEVVPGTPDCR